MQIFVTKEGIIIKLYLMYHYRNAVITRSFFMTSQKFKSLFLLFFIYKYFDTDMTIIVTITITS